MKRLSARRILPESGSIPAQRSLPARSGQASFFCSVNHSPCAFNRLQVYRPRMSNTLR